MKGRKETKYDVHARCRCTGAGRDEQMHAEGYLSYEALATAIENEIDCGPRFADEYSTSETSKWRLAVINICTYIHVTERYPDGRAAEI